MNLSNLSFHKQFPITTGQRTHDSRPVTTDAFKQEATKTVIAFLCYAQYPNKISAPELKAPSRSTLVEIWNHLFQYVDTSARINTANANEEVPRLFKLLGYPVSITKSSMQTPGAAHQWPHHLAALAWLCQLFAYESEEYSGLLVEDEPEDWNDASEDFARFCSSKIPPEMLSDADDISGYTIKRFPQWLSNQWESTRAATEGDVEEKLGQRTREAQEQLDSVKIVADEQQRKLEYVQEALRQIEARKLENGRNEKKIREMEMEADEKENQLPEKVELLTAEINREKQAKEEIRQHQLRVEALKNILVTQGLNREEKNQIKEELSTLIQEELKQTQILEPLKDEAKKKQVKFLSDKEKLEQCLAATATQLSRHRALITDLEPLETKWDSIKIPIIQTCDMAIQETLKRRPAQPHWHFINPSAETLMEQCQEAINIDKETLERLRGRYSQLETTLKLLQAKRAGQLDEKNRIQNVLATNEKSFARSDRELALNLKKAQDELWKIEQDCNETQRTAEADRQRAKEAVTELTRSLNSQAVSHQSELSSKLKELQEALQFSLSTKQKYIEELSKFECLKMQELADLMSELALDSAADPLLLLDRTSTNTLPDSSTVINSEFGKQDHQVSSPGSSPNFATHRRGTSSSSIMTRTGLLIDL